MQGLMPKSMVLVFDAAPLRSCVGVRAQGMLQYVSALPAAVL
jgi:hypothetical protein